jgi:hypothetical protein
MKNRAFLTSEVISKPTLHNEETNLWENHYRRNFIVNFLMFIPSLFGFGSIYSSTQEETFSEIPEVRGRKKNGSNSPGFGKRDIS